MKDHLYIKENIFYYGSLDTEDDILDNPVQFSQLNYLVASQINQICFDLSELRIIIEHGNNNDEAIIELASRELLDHHYHEILRCFPNSHLLNDEKKKLRLIRKPLSAIGIILCFYIIACATNPNQVSRTGSWRRNALDGIFQALASMGVELLSVVTVIVLLLPILVIYFKIRNAKNKRILKFKPNN